LGSREVGLDAFQQTLQWHGRQPWFHRAGVEPGNVEHGAEDDLDRFQRGVDIANHAAIIRIPEPFDQ
jgi:hypothetical protein